jgi:predicted secreted protein
MDPVLAIAIYIILWWLAFFIMLPIGVKSLDEAGVSARGHDQGAPETPNLGKKAIWAGGLATVVWIILYVVLHFTFYSR